MKKDLTGKFWIYDYYNKWSVDKYTEEEAEKHSKTLINCSGCTDCKDCIGCDNCEDCSYCTYCKYCKSCAKCILCGDCYNCRWCNYCTWVRGGIDTKNSIRCMAEDNKEKKDRFISIR